MACEFYDLQDATEILDVDGLTIPRARALATAIGRQRDFSIVRLLKGTILPTEYIVVDAETDIPSKNPAGIKYRERLALCVSDNSKRLVEVRALRKGFPLLIHQNQVGIDGLPSLCLYFEPPLSVLRTWTPQKFLHRIQWWLEKSARGELHPADQPVESLFFTTKYELVLPWNFNEIVKDQKHRLVAMGRERPDGGVTICLEPAQKQGPATPVIKCIELNLPAIVHGIVENHPVTAGQLYDLLKKRGIDLFTPLKEELARCVGPAGANPISDNHFTIFLLHIPICRTENDQPERIDRRAFLLSGGVLKLGLDTGALFLSPTDQKYYNANTLMNTAPATEWRRCSLESVEVLYENDSGAARFQSGVNDPGPEGVLIGAGSLGSTLLNLWGRCGWGRWTVIDKDHIKPHNLSRHTAYTQHIGRSKVSVVADLHSATMADNVMVPIYGDACDLNNSEISAPLKKAGLVIDASTTLEYPRLASTADDLGRHISAFITPTANAAVLLAEDSKRTIRLRTLEAQYYRALIQSPWGQRHLDGNNGQFWSGASCRDISFIMPYSKIMAHASTLAEQIPLASNCDSASIRIWERNPVNGEIITYDVEVHTERLFASDGLDIYLDGGVEQQIRDLRTAALPRETGGVLLGYYDFNINAAVIVCALPAPPDSVSTPGSFERGTIGLIDAVKEASRRTAHIVDYIGEWHSHPRGHSALPSGDDIVQLTHLAAEMANDGLPALQLIMGEKDIQVIRGELRA